MMLLYELYKSFCRIVYILMTLVFYIYEYIIIAAFFCVLCQNDPTQDSGEANPWLSVFESVFSGISWRIQIWPNFSVFIIPSV